MCLTRAIRRDSLDVSIVSQNKSRWKNVNEQLPLWVTIKQKFSINLSSKSDQIYHLWYQISGWQTCACLTLLTTWDKRYNYYWSELVSLVSTCAPAMPYFWALSIWTCWSSKNIWGFIALSIGPLGAPAKKCISSIINPHALSVWNNNNTTRDIKQHK